MNSLSLGSIERDGWNWLLLLYQLVRVSRPVRGCPWACIFTLPANEWSPACLLAWAEVDRPRIQEQLTIRPSAMRPYAYILDYTIRVYLHIMRRDARRTNVAKLFLADKLFWCLQNNGRLICANAHTIRYRTNSFFFFLVEELCIIKHKMIRLLEKNVFNTS